MNKALEDLQAGRDPSAPTPEQETEYESGAERCLRLARWGFWLRISAALLSLGIAQALAGDSANVVFIGTLVGLGICSLMVVASMVLAVIVLCGVPKYGPDGILWRSVRGLVYGFVLLGYFSNDALDLVRVDIKTEQALLELRQAGNKVRAETKNDFEQNGAVSPASQAQKIEQLKGAVDTAAQNVTGDGALMMRATSTYIGQMQALTTGYAAAARALLEPPVLNMNGVTRREQLLEKKETVKKFMTANEKLEAFMVNSEDIYRKELEKLQVPQDAVEQTLVEFRKQAKSRSELTLKIREADQRKGTALLGMLDVLDVNWGKWKFNPDTRKVTFDSDAALDQYITYREAMDAAAQEQTRLQAQLMNVASN